jgi:aspartyl protease
MCTRRETCIKAASLIAAFVTPVRGQRRQGNTNSEELTIPFDFAAGRGSLLVRVRIDNRPALLIVDTGSSHTILRPSIAGVSPAELAAPRSGAGVIGDAVGREITLEVGQRVWPRRRVAVMDLSQSLSAYQEKIDGLLGIDFFLEFSQAVIHLKNRRVTFVP